MTFKKFFSSSSGNLYTVTSSNGQRLLIECGVRWPILQRALDYDLSGIEGCLLTHEHQDHAKAAHDVLRAGIGLYSSAGTIDALGISPERRTCCIGLNESDYIGDFKVFIFPVNHDAAEPVGFVIADSADGESLLFIVDCSHIEQRFLTPFNIIAIGCSYDTNVVEQRVQSGQINEALARRLLFSHMDWRDAASYINVYCNLTKCREINLLHMSADNLIKKQVKREFERRFFIETKV